MSRCALRTVPKELLSAYRVRRLGNGPALSSCKRFPLTRRIRRRGMDSSAASSTSWLLSAHSVVHQRYVFLLVAAYTVHFEWKGHHQAGGFIKRDARGVAAAEMHPLMMQ